jgi:branched-chain amino acid transport system substrate-binding protein
VFLNSGAATSDLSGKACTPNTIHWTYDTFALANGTGKAIVKNGGDTWFFLTADYAFGHALERDTSAVSTKNGGKVVGRCASAQFGGLLVLPAAGAGVEGQDHRPGQRRRRHHQLDQAGGRVRHHVGRPEAGGLLLFITDVHALG